MRRRRAPTIGLDTRRGRRAVAASLGLVLSAAILVPPAGASGSVTITGLTAVDYAEQARTSAAVYERLKEAQPDFRLEVFGLRKEVAGLRDRQSLLEERNNAVRGDTDRIDETLCRVKETAEMTARTLVGRHYLTQPSGAAPAQD